MSNDDHSQPEQVGPYRIVKQLGQGGMGVVYEAVNEGIGRRVAVKVLRSEYAHNSEVAHRFFNEARAANLIEHPALVQISEFGVLPDGATYLVMELLKGENLASRLRSVGALPLPYVLRIGCQLAEVLCAAHQKNIIHRDLKPENVMLVPDSAVAGGERVKLLDFGIAKLAEAGAHKTATSALMGTPKYMSPEQARGAGQVDEKTDVYALGVMLFELLSGRPPFEGQAGELIAQHLYTTPPDLAALVPSLPPGVGQLCRRLLEKDRLMRPTMTVALQELQAQLDLLDDTEYPEISAPGVSTRSRRARKDSSSLGFSVNRLLRLRKRAPLIGIGAVLALVGIGAGYFVHTGSKTAAPTPAMGAAPVPAAPASDSRTRRDDALTTRRHWSIKTTPPAAQVLRAADEHEVGRTPWGFDPPVGSGNQDFIVRLKGYEDQTLHFRGTADSEQSVILERKLESKKEGRAKATPKSAPESAAPLFTPKSWMNK